MILELKNIEKSFGEKKVLTGVSFKAEPNNNSGRIRLPKTLWTTDHRCNRPKYMGTDRSYI